MDCVAAINVLVEVIRCTIEKNVVTTMRMMVFIRFARETKKVNMIVIIVVYTKTTRNTMGKNIMNDRKEFEEWISNWDESFKEAARVVSERIESVPEPHNPRAAGKTLAAMLDCHRRRLIEEEKKRLMNDKGIPYDMKRQIEILRSSPTYNERDVEAICSLADCGVETNPLSKYSTSQLKAELRRRKGK